MAKDKKKDESADSIEEYGIWVTSDPEPIEAPSNEEDVLTVSGLNLQDTSSEEGPYGLSPQREQSSRASNDSALSRIAVLETEMSSLKGELSGLKESIQQLTNVMKRSQQKEDEEKPAAFFEDDDSDETIALNVNELENILTTSEVTELNIAEEDAAATIAVPDGNIEPLDGNIDDNLSPVLTNDIIPTEDEESILIIGDDEIEDEFISQNISDVSEIDDESPSKGGLFGLSDNDEDESIILPESELATLSNDTNGVDPTMDMDTIDEIVDPNFETGTITNVEEISDDELNIPKPSDLGISDDEISSVSKTVMLDSNIDNISEQVSLVGKELRNEINSALSLLKQILQTLPEQKIKEYENTDYFSSYKRLEQVLSV